MYKLLMMETMRTPRIARLPAGLMPVELSCGDMYMYSTAMIAAKAVPGKHTKKERTNKWCLPSSLY